jgi:hypothetical protein
MIPGERKEAARIALAEAISAFPAHSRCGGGFGDRKASLKSAKEDQLAKRSPAGGRAARNVVHRQG